MKSFAQAEYEAILSHEAELNDRITLLESWLITVLAAVETAPYATLGDLYTGKQVFLHDDTIAGMKKALDRRSVEETLVDKF